MLRVRRRDDREDVARPAGAGAFAHDSASSRRSAFAHRQRKQRAKTPSRPDRDDGERASWLTSFEKPPGSCGCSFSVAVIRDAPLARRRAKPLQAGCEAPPRRARLVLWIGQMPALRNRPCEGGGGDPFGKWARSDGRAVGSVTAAPQNFGCPPGCHRFKRESEPCKCCAQGVGYSHRKDVPSVAAARRPGPRPCSGSVHRPST